MQKAWLPVVQVVQEVRLRSKATDKNLACGGSVWAAWRCSQSCNDRRRKDRAKHPGSVAPSDLGNLIARENFVD